MSELLRTFNNQGQISEKCGNYILLYKNMSFDNEIILSNLSQFLSASPLSDKLFQDPVSSTKTLASDSHNQLCKQISGIKKVKVGKRGDFKLVQENISAMRNVVLHTRRAHKSKVWESVQSSSAQSSTTRKSKNTKTINKQKSRVHKKKKSISLATTQQIKSIFSESQFQNSSDKQNLTALNPFRYKGMTQNSNTVQGGIGHCTLVFSNQITEGAYYIQLRVFGLDQVSKDQGYANPSEIRIGVCRPKHRLDVPLGIQESIGFLLSRKAVVTSGKIQNLTQVNPQVISKQIRNGDVIGFLLHFSSPYRNPNKLQKWEDSHLTFFLNGQLMGRYSDVKQMFYHPAISIYNGACLEIRTRAEQMDHLPQSCLPYQKIKQYINIYH